MARGMGDLLDSVEAEWRDAVTRWENAVADFQNALALHYSNETMATELGDHDEWSAQLYKATGIQDAITNLQQKLAGASDWFKQTFGLSGLNRMGFIPLIPVAVIVGAIAAVVSITSALYTYNAELVRKWNYVNANNLTPDQTQALMNSGQGPLDSIGNAAKNVSGLMLMIVGIGLLLRFGPDLMHNFKKARK